MPHTPGAAPQSPNSAPLADTTLLLKAIRFAAAKHRNQRRKDVEASPYINHPIEVATVLAEHGGVTDLTTLLGAILHDTIEDTQTSAAELEQHFGPAVRQLVQELTDDKSLRQHDRKRLQAEYAAHKSPRAKVVRLGDKICNVLDVTNQPPSTWDLARRQEYLDWTEQVIAGCRGVNARLDAYYDKVLAAGRAALGAGAGGREA